jgi:hypothetical protein
MLRLGDIERLDSALASRAGQDAALRLRLGQVLEVIGRGAVFDLGFSSLGAYAVERCERSVRWVEAACTLARRLEALPALRRDVALGKVSWSMAELLARVATPEDEARWIERARCRTVRQMRGLVAEALAAGEGVSAAAGAASAGTEDGVESLQSDGADDICTLTCTVDREDAWLFEATRCLLDQLGQRSAVEQMDALLAEAQSTLLALLPKGELDLERAEKNVASHRCQLEKLQRWRAEAEGLCESNILDALRSTRAGTTEAAPTAWSVAIDASVGMAPLEHASASDLDEQVRALSGTWARHELEVSRLALELHRADGWRRLGYASEAQYARERLGLSRSSLRARRTLALRLERLPGVAAALAVAHIGVEAALQLVRIATAATEEAWIARARHRTIKHLREEVAAALIAVRLSGETDCPPPVDTELAAFQTLEQAVVSGRFARVKSANDGAATNDASHSTSRPVTEPASESRKAWCLMLNSLASWIEGGCQTSARPSSSVPRSPSLAGRVRLRLRMSREAALWWRELEGYARQWLPAEMSWLRFMCLSLWQAWRHLTGSDVAYGHIYARDRYHCSSPVCDRRDVTPHHLQFRSAGGSDADDNVASVCTWCHLYGVHGGRIRALGTAAHIHWELGPIDAPSVIVDGRDRLVA